MRQIFQRRSPGARERSLRLCWMRISSPIAQRRHGGTWRAVGFFTRFVDFTLTGGGDTLKVASGRLIGLHRVS